MKKQQRKGAPLLAWVLGLIAFVVSAIFRFLMLLLLLCSLTPAFATPTTPDSDFNDNGEGTVTHKITGLTWKRCIEGQTWDGKTCTSYAETFTYDQALQLSSVFAGKNDWRLPTIAELKTIVEREKVNPAINTTMLPVPHDLYLGNQFWSSSGLALNRGKAWYVDFDNGDDGTFNNSASLGVRLVRGGQLLDSSGEYTPTSAFTDHGNGTVTHKSTGLMWQRCSVGQTWDGNTCSGTAATYTYNNALVLKSNLAGQTDWRLPTLNELATIVEYKTLNPAINRSLFPNTPFYIYPFNPSSTSSFWSASVSAFPRDAWSVIFFDGSFQPADKLDLLQVRLVRSDSMPPPNPNIECLLDWAQTNYPSLFSPPVSGLQFFSPYTYRYYENTNAYVGVSSADNHVYYLGPDGVLQDVGDLFAWLTTAGCQ